MFLTRTVTLTLVLLVELLSALSPYEVVFSWKQLDYNFPDRVSRNLLVDSKAFIPENNIIAGVKVYENRVFLTVPRWREGVPSTLNYVCLNGTNDISSSPLLIPYPSWEFQELGNCSCLQFTMSMEIDQFGRMWVMDVGRVNILTEPDNSCPPKLLLIDLNTDEVLKRYEFPESVVGYNSNFLNDIVVKCKESKEDCFVYITDTYDAKLVVYSLKENRSWFVQHETMVADEEATIIPILGQNYTFKMNINGIAMSPLDSDCERVYYRPFSSFELYSYPTSLLNVAENGMILNDSNVFNHGHTSSQSGGIAMDSQGILYYGQLVNNSVGYFNTTSSRSLENSEMVLIQSDMDLQWVDTFAFDNEGHLYLTTNRQQMYATKTLDVDENNFRVIRVYIGNRSYMYSASEASCMMINN